jgi:hypothetical protein
MNMMMMMMMIMMKKRYEPQQTDSSFQKKANEGQIRDGQDKGTVTVATARYGICSIAIGDMQRVWRHRDGFIC